MALDFQRETQYSATGNDVATILLSLEQKCTCDD
jgi:hypothetical protein